MHLLMNRNTTSCQVSDQPQEFLGSHIPAGTLKLGDPDPAWKPLLPSIYKQRKSNQWGGMKRGGRRQPIIPQRNLQPSFFWYLRPPWPSPPWEPWRTPQANHYLEISPEALQTNRDLSKPALPNTAPLLGALVVLLCSMNTNKTLSICSV